MRPQDFILKLDASSSGPLYLRITRALAHAIEQGILKPGTPLPGARVLADQLGVNRKTVVGAYQELEAEGWVETQIGAGTFVSLRHPESPPQKWAVAGSESPGTAHTAFDLATSLAPLTQPLSGAYDFREGLPDPRLLPAEELTQAYHRGLRKHGGELLQYGEPRGNLALRKSLSEWLGERRGIVATPDQILITRGARQAMALVARALLPQAAAVAVEDPGHDAMWDVLREAQARLIPVPVDEGGLCLAGLDELLPREQVRMLYCTPHHQFPTGVGLAIDRRGPLLELAAKHRVALIENDFDFEFHYEGRPALPLASQDGRGLVITIGSFSKLLAPGIRLGYLVARASVVERLVRLKARMDAQGDRVLESAVADLMRDGTLHRHIRKARRAYQDRRDVMIQAISGWAGFPVLSAPGGLGLWAPLPQDLDGDAWVKACHHQGVLLDEPARYQLVPSHSRHLRLGFGAHTPEELEAGLKLMESALSAVRKQ